MKTALSSFVAWFDDRTGVRDFVRHALYESVPGGARYRYVWGSTLVLAFITQMITGTFLWMAYSPSSQTAWESVYYIQYEMQGGAVLRGIHHYMATFMVFLLAIHLLQVVIDGAYRAPREINFWLGLILMKIVLALALTGYLLPWDQKGYWATKVATNLMGLVPFFGEALQKLVMGGPDYGHHTLTRFFALHAGVLPGLLIFFLVLHVALFRKHGLHAKDPDRAPAQTFWPDQVLKDGVVCLAVLAAVLLLAIFSKPELGAPADPASPYAAARPEFYFLFLFQLLKYFPGRMEVYGALVLPGVVMGVLFLMPFLGRWRLGHRFNIAFTLALLLAAGVLTGLAWHDDHYARFHQYDPEKYAGDSAAQQAYSERIEASQSYLEAVEDAELQAERILELVRIHKIPPQGALSLLRDDPKIAGGKLFKQHCAGCHNFADPHGKPTRRELVNPHPSAPNLYGFGSREWIAGLLDPEQIAGPHYFGYELQGDDGEKFKSDFAEGDMVGFVNEILEADDDQKPQIAADVERVAAALSAQAQLPSQAEIDARDSQLIAEGEALMKEGFGWASSSCVDCHKFHDEGDYGYGPDLTGYASREWLIAFISNPEHERFYGENNDRMPAFHKHGEKGQNLLTKKELELIVDWLRGDWAMAEPAVQARIASE